MNISIARFLCVAVTASMVDGCATIVHGTDKQPIAIRSTPSNAEVVIDGTVRGRTPLDVDLAGKHQHDVLVRRDGFNPFETRLHKHISYLASGGILLGVVGLIGTGIDMATGGAYLLKPSQVDVELTRLDAAQPGANQRTIDGPPNDAAKSRNNIETR